MTRLLAMLCLTVLAAMTLGVAAPRTARADDVATRTAKRHFARGEKLFALGQFAEALAEYKNAYDAKPIPAFLFNVGQCYRNLGDYESAIFSYKKYLQLAPDADNRAQVEKLIEELEAKQQAADERDQRKAERDRAAGEATTLAPEPVAADPDERARTTAARTGDPFYRTWWFWTGVLVAGAGGGVAIYEATRNSAPTTDLGPPINFRQ